MEWQNHTQGGLKLWLTINILQKELRFEHSSRVYNNSNDKLEL